MAVVVLLLRQAASRKVEAQQGGGESGAAAADKGFTTRPRHGAGKHGDPNTTKASTFLRQRHGGHGTAPNMSACLRSPLLAPSSSPRQHTHRHPWRTYTAGATLGGPLRRRAACPIPCRDRLARTQHHQRSAAWRCWAACCWPTAVSSARQGAGISQPNNGGKRSVFTKGAQEGRCVGRRQVTMTSACNSAKCCAMQ